ncbi:MAG: hypothetical protein ACK5MQ_03590, partial [Pikeienuella sp.]
MIVAVLRRRAEARAIRASFDIDFYLTRHPEVAASGLDPIRHYIVAGAAKGFDPAPWFSSRHYAEQVPAAQRAGLTPFGHYLLKGRAAGLAPRPASAANPDFAQLFRMRGIDPEQAEAAIQAQERDVAHRLRDGVLAEMAAKAAALQPLLDNSAQRPLRPVVTPFGRDALAPSAALAAMQEAAGWRTARTVIAAPGGDDEAARRAAARLAHALAAEAGADQVLLLLTDAPGAAPPAEGARVIDFAAHAARIRAPGAREELMLALIRSLAPARVLNVESRLFRDMAGGYGRALAVSSRIYDHQLDGEARLRAQTRFLSDCDQALSGVLTETAAQAEALRLRHLAPPDWAARIIALEIPKKEAETGDYQDRLLSFLIET